MTASRLRAAGVAYLLGFGAVVGAVAQTAVTPATADPLGRPTAFKVGKAAAVALWYDAYWHMDLTTNKKNKDTFTGTVRADKGLLVGVFDALDKGTKVVAGDLLVAHKDGGGFDFRITNGGGIDALRFKLDPAATRVTLNVALNGVAAPARVMIGKAGKNPEAMPFSLPAHPKAP